MITGFDCRTLNIELIFELLFFVSTWKVAGKDENKHAVSYFINVCGNVGDGIAPEECNNKVQLCEGNTPLHVQTKKFYYGGMFHLNTSAVENYKM